MNIDALKQRLEELEPPVIRHREPKVVDREDLIRFDVRIFPPVGYWIEADDTITDDIIRLWNGRYSGTQVGSLFRTSEGKTANRYKCECRCRTCGKKEVKSVTKSDFVGYIIHYHDEGAIGGHSYEKWRLMFECDECRETREKLQEEESVSREASRKVSEKESTDAFICSFLDPDGKWNIDKKDWFKEMERNLWGCNQEDVYTFINRMPYKAFLLTPYWQAVAQQVKYRARYKCKLCNEGGVLNVHHRDYSIHGKEHSCINELLCLCQRCHSKHHDKLAEIK